MVAKLGNSSKPSIPFTLESEQNFGGRPTTAFQGKKRKIKE